MTNSDIPTYAQKALQAILMVSIGFLAYSIADLCSKVLQLHYSIYQVLTVSSFSALIITFLWLLKQHGVAALVPKNIKLHLVRAVVIAGTAYFFVRALHVLPLADFYGIAFLMPFISMILSIIFLKETVGWHRWGATAVGFLGVIILAGPQFDTIGEGVVCAAIGALCGATNMILLRKIGRDDPLPLYGIYPFAAIFILNMGALLWTESFQPFRAQDLSYFFIHGPILVLAITATSIGFSRTPETAIVAPFQYTQAIWGVLFGWWFFGTLPTQSTWAGLILIIAAGLYMVWREYKRRHHKI